MKKLLCPLAFSLILSANAFSQSKTLIGIVPFKGGGSSEQTLTYGGVSNSGNYQTAIQDAVGDAFLKAKRFSLVERQKMDQLTSEKELQKGEDFIDGAVIEQSRSLGAQYVVLGNISKASVSQKERTITHLPVPYVGGANSPTNFAEVAFSIRIVDVATGEIIASNSFSTTAKGKNAFEEALGDIQPKIEQFIKENFKVTASVASVEEKNSKGEVDKLLIAAGSNQGIKEKNEFKVFELTELEVDGKKLIRKKTIGSLVVVKVEDENFSVCQVKDGAAEIGRKIEAGAKIKCEIIN